MDCYVAADAFAAGLEAQPRVGHAELRVKSFVALEAKLPAFPPDEQLAVRASVRVMAGHASLNLCRGMFKNIRSAFFDVALHAGFRTGAGQRRGIIGTVRVVAIRALDQAFRHAVMDRLRKLGLNRLVAAVANLRFGLLQQAVVQPAVFVRQLRQLIKVKLRGSHGALAGVFHRVHKVRGVAIPAENAVSGMGGMLEQLLLLTRCMAGQAPRHVFIRRALEGKYRMVFHGLGDLRIIPMRRLDRIAVRLPWTVARLAAADVIGSGESQFGVARLFIFDCFMLVAIPAGVRTRILAGRRAEIRRPAGHRRPVNRLHPRLSPCRLDGENEYKK